MPLLTEIIIGCFAGYLAATIFESYCHRVFGHSGPRTTMFVRRFRRLLGWLKLIHFCHDTIHHRATYKNGFTVQFSDHSCRQSLLRKIPACYRDQVLQTDFGTTITLSSLPYFMAPGLITLSPLFLYSKLSLALAWFMLLLPPLMSMYLHPLIHLPARQLQHLPGISGFLMRTPLLRWIAMHHWLHHKYSDVNFNLLPGGDFLWGTHRRATEKDRADMLREGLLQPWHADHEH